MSKVGKTLWLSSLPYLFNSLLQFIEEAPIGTSDNGDSVTFQAPRRPSKDVILKMSRVSSLPNKLF